MYLHEKKYDYVSISRLDKIEKSDVFNLKKIVTLIIYYIVEEETTVRNKIAILFFKCRPLGVLLFKYNLKRIILYISQLSFHFCSFKSNYLLFASFSR